MDRVFIDVNIPMYAAGADHPLKTPSQKVIKAIASGELDAITDAEVFQEILYRYLHIGEREKGFMIFDLFHRIMRGRILAVEDSGVQRARELAEQYTFLSPRDLIHMAVMIQCDLDAIITTDKSFDRLKAIQRIDPQNFMEFMK